MLITVRIPTEPYAYYEVQYDSIEEYKKLHPTFADTMIQVRKGIKKEDHPFKGDEFSR